MLSPIHVHKVKELLNSSRTIAVVGLSPKENRPSNMVGRYLMNAGYQVIPVNPGQNEIFAQKCYPDLAAVPVKIDIVDIFRKTQDVLPIVEQAIAIGTRAVWMQLGIINEEAATRAREAGLICIMDLCIKIEHARIEA